MSAKTRAFLQLPQGAESFYLDEAQKHEEILNGLRDLYYSWGYLPVQTPVFDFYDIYRPLIDKSAGDKIYRLIDRDGDLLMLRSDVTLFLAKQMGMILTKEDVPLRVWYADTILRHQDEEDISKNEFFQVGTELIGKEGPAADLETLMLLVQSLEKTGLSDYHIHLGSRAIYSACFKNTGDAARKKLLDLIASRDAQGFTAVLLDEGFSAEHAGFLSRFFRYIGNAGGFEHLVDEGRKTGCLNTEASTAAAYLLELLRVITDLNPKDIFRLDLSEIGSQGYYTGIVFQAFKEGIDSAFASGGRYDDLLARFGQDAPSAGFSIMLRKIEGSLKDSANRHAGAVYLPDENFTKAYREAEELRKTGAVVLIGEEAHD